MFKRGRETCGDRDEILCCSTLKWLRLAAKGSNGMRQAKRQENETFDTDSDAEGGKPNQAHWEKVCARLRAELGPDVFRSWFTGVLCVHRGEDFVELRVPSRFRRDWIVSHYEDQLRQFWSHEDKSIKRVVLSLTPRYQSEQEITVREQGRHSVSASEEAKLKGEASRHEGSNSGALNVATPQLFVPDTEFDLERLGAPLDPRFTFENFVVGDSNALACSAAKQVSESPAQVYNPLYLYGQVGIGKTHLLHAIAWEMRRANPDCKILYLSAERFMYRFVQSLRQKDVMTFKDHFRGVDILLLDDVQFIANKASTQEEFFHTFDALIGQNRQVVITADRPPSDLDGVGERIRSRLGQGLSTDIRATDFDLRYGILRHKLAALQTKRGRQAEIPKGVLEFIAHRLVSNIRVLEGALTRLTAHAALTDRPITIDLAKDILSDLLRTCDRKVTIDDIQRSVARYFSLSMSDLVSARRAREVARPRQIAMYLCKQLTTRSLPEIGRKFGGRDHTTVIHAVRKIEELRSGDHAIDGDVETLRREISGGLGR